MLISDRSEMSHRAIMPLFNFKSTVDRIELDDNLSIRSISQEEVDEMQHGMVTIIDELEMDMISYALETQLVRYEGNEVNRVNDLFEKVILSLRLFKSGEVNQKVTFFKREEGRGARAFWRPKKTSMTLRPYNLTTNEISKFIALLNKARSIDLNKRRDLNISIHRFSKTYDDSLEEKFIDLMIAMESLVLFKGKGEGRSNIKEKIAVGVSMLIGKNFKEKLTLEERRLIYGSSRFEGGL